MRFLIALFVFLPALASADYSQCILENMKGVGSDVAAEEIRKACEQTSSPSKETPQASTEPTSEAEARLISAQSDNALIDEPSWMQALSNGITGLFGEDKDSLACAFHSFHCIPKQFIEWEELLLNDEYVRNEPDLIFDGDLFRVKGEANPEGYSGEVASYFLSGRLASRVLFENGGLHGAFSRWYPNGAIAVKGSYKRGYLSGEYKEFFENGRLRAQTTMNGGRPTKELKLWYETGGLRSRFKLTASGKFNSSGRAWYEDGSIAFEGKFSRGRVFGQHKVFHPSGASAVDYKLVLGFEERCYDEDPKIVSEQKSLRYGRQKSDGFKEYFAPNLSCEGLNSATIAKIATARDEKGNVLWKSTSEGLFVSGPHGEMVAVKFE